MNVRDPFRFSLFSEGLIRIGHCGADLTIRASLRGIQTSEVGPGKYSACGISHATHTYADMCRCMHIRMRICTYIYTHTHKSIVCCGQVDIARTNPHAQRVLERHASTRRRTAEIPDAPGARIMLDRNYSQPRQTRSVLKPHIAA